MHRWFGRSLSKTQPPRIPVIINFLAELFCYTIQNTRGLVLWYCCVKSAKKNFHALLVLFERTHKPTGTYRDQGRFELVKNNIDALYKDSQDRKAQVRIMCFCHYSAIFIFNKSQKYKNNHYRLNDFCSNFI